MIRSASEQEKRGIYLNFVCIVPSPLDSPADQWICQRGRCAMCRPWNRAVRFRGWQWEQNCAFWTHCQVLTITARFQGLAMIEIAWDLASWPQCLLNGQKFGCSHKTWPRFLLSIVQRERAWFRALLLRLRPLNHSLSEGEGAERKRRKIPMGAEIREAFSSAFWLIWLPFPESTNLRGLRSEVPLRSM